MFSTLPKSSLNFSFTFILSPANAFNLDQFKILLFGKELKKLETGSVLRKVNPFPNKPWFFTCLQYKSFENTVGKGEIARNEQFLVFPHSVFYPFEKLSAIFIKFEIVVS